MSNWCWNKICISGDSKEIKRFLTGGIGEDENDLSFLEAYYPCPVELRTEVKDEEERKNRIAKYGFDGWYNWCRKHWDAKWHENLLHVEYVDGASTGSITFESAWTPPLAGYGKISEQFPNLKFEFYYEEPSMAYCGDAIIQNGMIDDDCREYVNDDEEDEEETEIAG